MPLRRKRGVGFPKPFDSTAPRTLRIQQESTQEVAMAHRLEFFFDYTSPFSYLADTPLPRIAQRPGAEIAYRPMFLGGVMQETGNQPPAALPARAKYMPDDIRRWVSRYGIEFAFNPDFPLQTLAALRAAYAA